MHSTTWSFRSGITRKHKSSRLSYLAVILCMSGVSETRNRVLLSTWRHTLVATGGHIPLLSRMQLDAVTGVSAAYVIFIISEGKDLLRQRNSCFRFTRTRLDADQLMSRRRQGPGKERRYKAKFDDVVFPARLEHLRTGQLPGAEPPDKVTSVTLE